MISIYVNRYYEQKSWKVFKNKVFQSLLSPKQPKNIYKKKPKYLSPGKDDLKLPKLSTPKQKESKEMTVNIKKPKMSFFKNRVYQTKRS
mmetsp:Transcript_29042/g.28717  ORF Transcript_29042/g.28717 Transcript_29042/m.28717 type:complete len:89 (-) Transcript_29042:80-346(-)